MKILPITSKSLITVLIAVTIWSCNDRYTYEAGAKHFQNSEYELAIIELEKIDESDDYYSNAQSLLIQIDSLREIKKKEQLVLDSLERVKQCNNEIERLKIEISRIKNYDREKCYFVGCLREQIKEFEAWSSLYYKSQDYYCNDAKQLGEDLLSNLKNLQAREFPKIRSEFASISDKELWEDDIDVKNYGSRKTTIEFIGGFFSLNRNIKNFQDSFRPALSEFRFKKVIYKWSKYSDEYTYYDLNTKKDSDI